MAIIARQLLRGIFYELPHLNSAVYHASFYPCTVDAACHGPEPWEVSWFTAMFMHGSWDHILGNMLFLAIFGKNVEDAFGTCATSPSTSRAASWRSWDADRDACFLSAAAAGVNELGASGAIAAVLGAYFVLYPNSRVLTLVLVFPVRIPAWIFLRRVVPLRRTWWKGTSACSQRTPTAAGSRSRPAFRRADSSLA